MGNPQVEVLSALGFVYLALGQGRRALALLLVAARLDPGSREVRLLLGHAFTEAGEPERALEILDRLLADGPGQHAHEPVTLLLRSRALLAIDAKAEARACFGDYLARHAAGARQEARG